MALDDTIHKKMVKVVLGKMAGLDKLEELKDLEEESILDTVKESAKPRIRGLKEFFLLGLNEMKKDFKKTKRKYEK